jgi:hypothetical protein
MPSCSKSLRDLPVQVRAAADDDVQAADGRPPNGVQLFQRSGPMPSLRSAALSRSAAAAARPFRPPPHRAISGCRASPR